MNILKYRKYPIYRKVKVVTLNLILNIIKKSIHLYEDNKHIEYSVH